LFLGLFYWYTEGAVGGKTRAKVGYLGKRKLDIFSFPEVMKNKTDGGKRGKFTVGAKRGKTTTEAETHFQDSWWG